MASREDDPKLDAALTALAGMAEPPPGDDDARWAKRVASRVSTFPAPSRRDLDPLFEAPFPDGFVDVTPQAGHRDFDHAPIAADDHTNAASAADFGDSGWEGSMSDSDSRPPNSLAALSGLTRSGPASNPDAMEGAAKGDDSGLINLKAMTEPAAPPPEEVAAAAESAPTAAAEPARSVKTAAAAPSAISGAKIPVASTASANAPPASSTQASAVSAPAAQPAAAKKSSAVVWLGLAGVAAAAAAAFMFVGPMARKSEEPASAQPAAAPPAVEKKAADEKVAANEPPAANPTAAPEPEQAADPAQPHAGNAPGKPLATLGASKAGPVDTKALPPTPAASAKPTTTAAEAPKTNPAGGSLDDVLGIGKDQPAAKKVETDNLPDKPESMDVRSAINSKLSGGNACVKGLEGPSNVSVTFGPSGTVSGVVVTSGPAKGTGAEACIKNAFSSAKVPASKKGASGSATLVP